MISLIVMYVFTFSITIGSLFNTFTGVVGYYFLSFYRPQEVYWWSLSDSRLSFYVAVSTILSYFIHKKEYINEVKQYVIQDYLILLFWVWISLSYMSSVDKTSSWPVYTIIAKLILFYFVATVVINTKERFNKMLLMMMFAFGWLAIWANQRYFIDGWSVVHGPGLPGGTFFDRNSFSLVFVMSMPIYYFFALVNKKIFMKGILFIAMLVNIHANLLTQSRGGFLGMILALFLCFLRTPKKIRLLFILVIFFPIFLRMWGKENRERMATIFVSTEERDESAQGRVEAWNAGYKIIKKYPLFGVGFRNYVKTMAIIEPDAKAKEAHNTYIQIGAENGIPALLLVLLAIILSIIDTEIMIIYFKSRDPTLYIYASILQSSLVGFFISSLFLSLQMCEPFYFYICLVAILKKLKLKYKLQENKYYLSKRVN